MASCIFDKEITEPKSTEFALDFYSNNKGNNNVADFVQHIFEKYVDQIKNSGEDIGEDMSGDAIYDRIQSTYKQSLRGIYRILYNVEPEKELNKATVDAIGSRINSHINGIPDKISEKKISKSQKDAELNLIRESILDDVLSGNSTSSVQQLFNTYFDNYLLRNKKTNFIEFFKKHIADNSEVILGLYGNTQENIDDIKSSLNDKVFKFFNEHSRYSWNERSSGSLYIVEKEKISDNIFESESGITISKWLASEINNAQNTDYSRSEIENILMSNYVESGADSIVDYLKTAQDGISSSIIDILNINNNTMLADYLASIPGYTISNKDGLVVKKVSIGTVENPYSILIAEGYDSENETHTKELADVVSLESGVGADDILNNMSNESKQISDSKLLDAVFASTMLHGFNSMLSELYPYISKNYIESYRRGFSDNIVSFSEQESGRQKFIKETTRRLKYIKTGDGEFRLEQDTNKPYLTVNDFDAISRDLVKYKYDTKSMIRYIKENGSPESTHRYKDIFTSIYLRFFDDNYNGNDIFEYNPASNTLENSGTNFKSIKVHSYTDYKKTDDIITSVISMLKTNTPIDKVNITNGIQKIGDIGNATKIEYATNVLMGRAVTRDMSFIDQSTPMFVLNSAIARAFDLNFNRNNDIITITSKGTFSRDPDNTITIRIEKNESTAGNKVGARYKVVSINGESKFIENIDAIRNIFSPFGIDPILFNPNYVKYLKDVLERIDHKGANDSWLGENKYIGFLVNNLFEIKEYSKSKPGDNIVSSFILREALSRVSDKIIGSTVSRYMIQNGKAIPGQSISSPLSNLYAIIDNAVNNDGLMHNSILARGGIRFSRTVYKGTVQYGDSIKELKDMQEGEIATFNIRDIFLKSIAANASKNSVLIPGKPMADRSMQPNYEVIIPPISKGIHRWELVPLKKAGELNTEAYEDQWIISNKLYFDSTKRRIFDKWLKFSDIINNNSLKSAILRTHTLKDLDDIITQASRDGVVSEDAVKNNKALISNLDYVIEQGRVKINRNILLKEQLFTGDAENILIAGAAQTNPEKSIVTLDDVIKTKNVGELAALNAQMSPITKTDNTFIEKDGTIDFSDDAKHLLYSLKESVSNNKIVRNYLRYELDAFKDRTKLSGFTPDKLTTSNLYSILNILGVKSLYNVTNKATSLFDKLLTMYFYNTSGIGNELHRLSAGPVEQYDASYEKIGSGKFLASPVLAPVYNDIIDAIDGKTSMSDVKERLRAFINGVRQADGTIINNGVVASESRKNLLSGLVEMISTDSEENSAINTKNKAVLKSLMLYDINSSSINSMLNQTKRNSSLGSGGIVPVIQNAVEHGFKLEDHSKVVTFTDPTAIMTALGAFGIESGFELYNGIQLALPLWQIKMNNSIGNDLSNFKIDNNSVKDITVGPTKSGINIVEKKSTWIISPEMIKKATPEFQALIRNMLSTIKLDKIVTKDANGTIISEEYPRVFVENQSANKTQLSYDMWVEYGGSLGIIEDSAGKKYDAKDIAMLIRFDDRLADEFRTMLLAGELSVRGTTENITSVNDLYIILQNKYNEEEVWNKMADILGYTTGVRGITSDKDLELNKFRFNFTAEDNPYKYRNSYIEKLGFLSEKKTGNNVLLNPEHFTNPIETIKNGFLSQDGTPTYSETPNIGEYIILNSMESTDTTAVDSHISSGNEIKPKEQASLSLPRQSLNAIVFGSDSKGMSPKLDGALSALSVVSIYGIYEDILSEADHVNEASSDIINSLRTKLYDGGIIDPRSLDGDEATILEKLYKSYVTNVLKHKLEISAGVASTAMDLVSNSKGNVSYDMGVINAYMSNAINSTFKKFGISVKISGAITTLEAAHHMMRLYSHNGVDNLTREEYNKAVMSDVNVVPVDITKETAKYLQNEDLVFDPSLKKVRKVKDVEYDAFREAQSNGVSYSRDYLEDYLVRNRFNSRLHDILVPEAGRELKYINYYKIEDGKKINLSDTEEVKAKELVNKLYALDGISRDKLVTYTDDLRNIYSKSEYKNAGMSFNDFKLMLLNDGLVANEVANKIKSNIIVELAYNRVLLRDFYYFFPKDGSNIKPEFSVVEMQEFRNFVSRLMNGVGSIKNLNETSSKIAEIILNNKSLVKARLLYNIHKELSSNSYVGVPAEFMTPSMHNTALFIKPEDSVVTFTKDAVVPDYRELMAKGIFTHENAKLYYSTLFNNDSKKFISSLLESNPEMVLPLIESIKLPNNVSINNSGTLKNYLFTGIKSSEIGLKLDSYYKYIINNSPEDYINIKQEFNRLLKSGDTASITEYPTIIKTLLSKSILDLDVIDTKEAITGKNLYDVLSKSMGDSFDEYLNTFKGLESSINYLKDFTDKLLAVRENIRNTIKDRIDEYLDESGITKYVSLDRNTKVWKKSYYTVLEKALNMNPKEGVNIIADYTDGIDGPIANLEEVKDRLVRYKSKLGRLSASNYGSIISTLLYEPHIVKINDKIDTIDKFIDKFNSLSEELSSVMMHDGDDSEFKSILDKYTELSLKSTDFLASKIRPLNVISREKYVNARAELATNSFLPSLEFYTTRIPTQGKPSTAAGKIAQFYSSGKNMMVAARELTYIQGSDHDHDHQHSIAASLGTDGEYIWWDKFTDNGRLSGKIDENKLKSLISDVLNYDNLDLSYSELNRIRKVKLNKLLTDYRKATSNYILHHLIEETLSPTRALEIFQPLRADDVYAAEQPEYLPDANDNFSIGKILNILKYNSEFDPSSDVQMLKRAMVGKDAINYFASGLRGYGVSEQAMLSMAELSKTAEQLENNIKSTRFRSPFGVMGNRVIETIPEEFKPIFEKYILTKPGTTNQNGMPVIFLDKSGEIRKIKILDRLGGTNKILSDKSSGYLDGKSKLRIIHSLTKEYSAAGEDRRAEIEAEQVKLLSDPNISLYAKYAVPSSEVWEQLSQLITASVDNVKELILGKIKSNSITNSMLSTMVRAGLTIPESVELISELYDYKDGAIIRSVEQHNNKLDPAKPGTKTYSSLATAIINEAKNVSSSITKDPIYKNIAVRLASFAELDRSLNVVSQMSSIISNPKVKPSEIYQFIDRLSTVNGYDFDFKKFVNDAVRGDGNYVKTVLEETEKENKSGINPVRILYMNKMLLTYFDATLQSLKLINSVSTSNVAIENAFKILADKYGKLYNINKEEAYRRIAKSYASVGIVRYLASDVFSGKDLLPKTLSIKLAKDDIERIYDLSSAHNHGNMLGREQFVLDLPDILVEAQKILPKNRFLDAAANTITRVDETTAIPFKKVEAVNQLLVDRHELINLKTALEELRDAPDTSVGETIDDHMFKSNLSNTIYNMLYYYSLIVNRGMFGSKSFSGLFGDTAYDGYSKSLVQNSNEILNLFSTRETIDELSKVDPGLVQHLSTNTLDVKNYANRMNNNSRGSAIFTSEDGTDVILEPEFNQDEDVLGEDVGSHKTKNRSNNFRLSEYNSIKRRSKNPLPDIFYSKQLRTLFQFNYDIGIYTPLVPDVLYSAIPLEYKNGTIKAMVHNGYKFNVGDKEYYLLGKLNSASDIVNIESKAKTHGFKVEKVLQDTDYNYYALEHVKNGVKTYRIVSQSILESMLKNTDIYANGDVIVRTSDVSGKDNRILNLVVEDDSNVSLHSILSSKVIGMGSEIPALKLFSDNIESSVEHSVKTKVDAYYDKLRKLDLGSAVINNSYKPYVTGADFLPDPANMTTAEKIIEIKKVLVTNFDNKLVNATVNGINNYKEVIDGKDITFIDTDGKEKPIYDFVVNGYSAVDGKLKFDSKILKDHIDKHMQDPLTFSDLVEVLTAAGSRNQIEDIGTLAKRHINNIDPKFTSAIYSGYRFGNIVGVFDNSVPKFTMHKIMFHELVNKEEEYFGEQETAPKITKNATLLEVIKAMNFSSILDAFEFIDKLGEVTFNNKPLLSETKDGVLVLNKTVFSRNLEDAIEKISEIGNEVSNTKLQLNHLNDNTAKELSTQAKDDVLTLVKSRVKTLFGDNASVEAMSTIEIAKLLGITVDEAANINGINKEDRIILNSDTFDVTTPFHEMTHIYMRHLKLVGNLEYRRLIEMAKQSAEFDKIKSRYSNLSDENVAEEVIAELIGRYSSDKLNSTDQPMVEKLNANGLWSRLKQWFKNLFNVIFGINTNVTPELDDSLKSFATKLGNEFLNSKESILDKLYKKSSNRIVHALSEGLIYEDGVKLLQDYGFIRTENGVEEYLDYNGSKSNTYYSIVDQLGEEIAKYKYVTEMLSGDTKLQTKGGTTPEERLKEMTTKPEEKLDRSPTALLRDEIKGEKLSEEELINKAARGFVRSSEENALDPDELGMELRISSKLGEKIKDENGKETTYGDLLKIALKKHMETTRVGGEDVHKALSYIMDKMSEEIEGGSGQFIVDGRIDIDKLYDWLNGRTGDNNSELGERVVLDALKNVDNIESQWGSGSVSSLQNIVKSIANKINDVANYWNMNVEDMKIKSELHLYDRDLNMHGIIDLVLYDNKNHRSYIIDYKGKSEKNIERFLVNYNRKYKGMFKDIQADSLGDAALQLSAYGVMFEDAGYTVTGGSAILLQIDTKYSYEDSKKDYIYRDPKYSINRFTNIIDVTMNTQLMRDYLSGKTYDPSKHSNAKGDILHLLEWGVTAGDDPGRLDPVLDHSDEYIERYINDIRRENGTVNYAVRTKTGYMKRVVVPENEFDEKEYRKELKSYYEDIMHQKHVKPSAITHWFNSGKHNINSLFKGDADAIAMLFHDIDSDQYTAHVASEYNRDLFGDLGNDVILVLSKDGKSMKLLSTLSVQNKKLKFKVDNRLEKRNTIYGRFATDEQVLAETDVANTYDVKPTLHELYAIKLAIAAMRYREVYNKDITVDSMKVSTLSGGNSDITYHSMEKEIGKLRIFQSLDKAFPKAISELLDRLPADVSNIFTYDSISALSDLLLHDTKSEFVKSLNISTNALAKEVYDTIKTFEPEKKLELEYKIGELYVNTYNSIKGKTKAEKVIDPKLTIIRTALLNLANINTTTKQIMFTGKLSELYPIRSTLDAPDYYVKKFEVVREKYMRIGAHKIDKFHKEHIKLIKAVTGGRTSFNRSDYLALFENPTFTGSPDTWMKTKDISKHPELTKEQKDYINFFNKHIKESLIILSKNNAAVSSIKEGHVDGVVPIMLSTNKIDTSSSDAFFKSINNYMMPRPKLYSDVDKAFKADRALEYRGKFHNEITDGNTQFSDKRREMLGLTEDSKPNLNQIEMNLSIILHSVKFAAETYKVFTSLTHTVNSLLDELYSREIKDHWNTGKTVDFILKMWSMSVQNQYKDDQFAKEMDKIRRWVSTLLFGANIQQIATETSTGIIRGTTAVFQQALIGAMGGDKRFTLKDWAWANRALFSLNKGEDSYIFKAALDNGMFYTDLKEFGSNTYTRLNKSKALQRDLIAGGNTAAHNQFRYSVFTAIAKHDGVIDAYKYGKDGKYYDETADKRFYVYDPELNLPGSKKVAPKEGTEDYKKWLIWKATRNRMVEEGFINDKTKRMEMAYIEEERNSINEYISNIFGSMRDDSRIYWDFFGISRQLTLYKRWASMKVNNYFTKTHDSYKHGYWKQYRDENGVDGARFEMAPREGIVQTIGNLAKALYNTRSIKGTMAEMDKGQKENLAILISDVMTMLAMTTAGTLLVNAHKKEIANNPFYLATWKGVVNGYSELNIAQLLLSMNTEVFPAVSILTGTMHNLGASVGLAATGDFKGSLHELGKTKSFFGGLKTAKSIGYFIDQDGFSMGTNKFVPRMNIDFTINPTRPSNF